jgi:hypothetical protein
MMRAPHGTPRTVGGAVSATQAQPENVRIPVEHPTDNLVPLPTGEVLVPAVPPDCDGGGEHGAAYPNRFGDLVCDRCWHIVAFSAGWVRPGVLGDATDAWARAEQARLAGIGWQVLDLRPPTSAAR